MMSNLISEENSGSEGVNLERSELRYIFYSHDQANLIDDFKGLGFDVQVFTETPTTITIYFGSITGLERGLSIKARIYTDRPIQNIWRITEDTEFNLLEIKSTVSREEMLMNGMEPDERLNQTGLMEISDREQSKDIVFRIQRASEDGLLKDSTLKLKSRVKKGDFNIERSLSGLKLGEIVTILTRKSDLDDRLSSDLLELLNTEVRPKYKKKLVPFVITQYNRLHLIPKKKELRDLIRITIDPGVDYYDAILNEDKRFSKDPNFTAEWLIRENFGRLEFKIDSVKMSKQPDLDTKISAILQKYGCIAYISKKWTGVTFVSERYIEKQAFWREPLGRQLSGFFPVDRSWFLTGLVTEHFIEMIKESNGFSSYKKKNPRILVKNENFVTGYLGVPIPSLVITVEGPKITYDLPSRSYPVKLSIGEPEFYIIEEFDQSVRSTVISSISDLEKFLHPSIEIENNTYFRSYGFLVRSENSNRIYKLTIERKVEVQGESPPETEVYCKMRYIGTENQLMKKDKQSIFDDLQLFYEEFAMAMSEEISIESSEDNDDEDDDY